jgi:hypothetical protein
MTGMARNLHILHVQRNRVSRFDDQLLQFPVCPANGNNPRRSSLGNRAA